MPIDKLVSMPSHQKVEDGYAYDPKFIGRVYLFNDTLIFFKEKSTVDIPLALVNAIKSYVIEELNIDQKFKNEINNLTTSITENTNKIILSSITDIVDDVELVKNNYNVLNEKLKKIISSLEKFKNHIDTVKENSLDENEINQIIDKKLTDVYNNFQKVVDELVKAKVTEGLKDSKRDQTGKLKLSTIAMMKEMGLSIDEVTTLSKEGLI